MVLTNTTGVIVELNAEVKALFGQGQHEVEMHGGTVIAQSHGLGAGSEFIVRIPLLTAITAPHEFGGALAPHGPSGGEQEIWPRWSIGGVVCG